MDPEYFFGALAYIFVLLLISLSLPSYFFTEIHISGQQISQPSISLSFVSNIVNVAKFLFLPVVIGNLPLYISIPLTFLNWIACTIAVIFLIEHTNLLKIAEAFAR